jgi:hypothetical protein
MMRLELPWINLLKGWDIVNLLLGKGVELKIYHENNKSIGCLNRRLVFFCICPGELNE